METRGFWTWLVRGMAGGKPGYRRVINVWTAFHVGVGLALAVGTSMAISQVASGVVLPLAGILVGLAFAWAGNAQALLQTKELVAMGKAVPGKMYDYIYTYQLAILVLIVAFVSWSIASIGVIDGILDKCVLPVESAGRLLVKTFLFSVSSLAIRECWHVVVGASWMLRRRIEIKDQGEGDEEE